MAQHGCDNISEVRVSPEHGYVMVPRAHVDGLGIGFRRVEVSRLDDHAIVVEDDDVKNIIIMMCGPPFIKYDGAQYNEVVRGAMDEAAGAVVMGKSKGDAGE